MLPDPIERGEAMAEYYMDKLDYRDGQINCNNCGKRINLSDSKMLSDDPYGQPYCSKCAGEWWTQNHLR